MKQFQSSLFVLYALKYLSAFASVFVPKILSEHEQLHKPETLRAKMRTKMKLPVSNLLRPLTQSRRCQFLHPALLGQLQVLWTGCRCATQRSGALFNLFVCTLFSLSKTQYSCKFLIGTAFQHTPLVFNQHHQPSLKKPFQLYIKKQFSCYTCMYFFN